MAGVPLKKKIPKSKPGAGAGTLQKKVPGKTADGGKSTPKQEVKKPEVMANEETKAKEAVKKGKGGKGKKTSKPANQSGNDNSSRPGKGTSEAEEITQNLNKAVKAHNNDNGNKWYENPKLIMNNSCLFPNRKLGGRCNDADCCIYHKCLATQFKRE